jgi:hypothetical protein
MKFWIEIGKRKLSLQFHFHKWVLSENYLYRVCKVCGKEELVD